MRITGEMRKRLQNSGNQNSENSYRKKNLFLTAAFQIQQLCPECYFLSIKFRAICLCTTYDEILYKFALNQQHPKKLLILSVSLKN